MTRKISACAVALVLLCALLPAAACTQTETAESPIAAEIGQRAITLDEVSKRYEYYINLFKTFGYPLPSSTSAIDELQDQVVDELLEKEILLYHADQLGLGELTDEQLADVEKYTDEQLEKLIDVYINRAKNEGTDSSRNTAIRSLEKMIQSSGMDMDWDEYKQYLHDQFVSDKIVDLLKECVTRNVTVNEAELQAYYDTTLEEQQKTYSSALSDCVDALSYYDKHGTSPVLYVPEGIVRARILTVNGVTKEAQHNINKAYEELQTGADFSEVLAKYGSTGDYLNYPVFAKTGVPVLLAGDDTYDKAIYETLNRLEIGTYSEPIVLDDSCVIVNLVSVEPAGVRSFDDMKNAVSATVLAQKQNDCWDKQKAVWLADTSEVIYHKEVYRSIGQ